MTTKDKAWFALFAIGGLLNLTLTIISLAGMHWWQSLLGLTGVMFAVVGITLQRLIMWCRKVMSEEGVDSKSTGD